MLPLHLNAPPGRPLSLLAVGAHPDDIEIGAGGLLLSLAKSSPTVRYVVLTGTAARQEEARDAARAFLPAVDPMVELCDLPEGRLPAVWAWSAPADNHAADRPPHIGAPRLRLE
jgi:LmbE family N-acetylglucosaminyl deacetylase